MAIRRAVARAGCRLHKVRLEAAELVIQDNGQPDEISELKEGAGDPDVVAKIACTDGWQAAKLLLALAIEDSKTPGAIALAAQLRADAGGTDLAFARAIQAYVKARVKFVREEGEIFQSGQITLARGAGDCDDHFRLAYAIARAGGLDAGLGLLYHADAPPPYNGPTHAGSVLCPSGACVWAETTVDAFFGEEPNAAAARLGLVSERDDIAKDVVIMKEADLAPLPEGFRDHNDPVQVRLDCEALQRLGWYPSDAPLTDDPTAAGFRLAVIDFQRSLSGVVTDGLIGPTTRLYILKALQSNGVEGFAYPGMGDLTTGGATLSADLSDDDLRAVIAMNQRFVDQGAKTAAEDFALVWTSESGIRNIQTGYVAPNGVRDTHAGYNQMGPDERAASGFSGSLTDWLSLTLSAQLPYIESYYRRAAAAGGGPACMTGASALYLANAAPAFMAHAASPGYVIYPPGSAAYAGNKGLDRAGKGYVTISDLTSALASVAGNKRFLEVRARLRSLGAAPSSSPPGSAGADLAGLLFVSSIATAAIVGRIKGWL